MNGALTGAGLIIDNFAGGGGASTGIEMALGRSPDVAINHDAEAVALHAANHPDTLHLCQNVWKADPREVVEQASWKRCAELGIPRAVLPVAFAWFSPDCRHFSKAKGSKPVEKGIRDLVWVVVHWADRVRPAVIGLENVEEFKDWGPRCPMFRACSRHFGSSRVWSRGVTEPAHLNEFKEMDGGRGRD